ARAASAAHAVHRHFRRRVSARCVVDGIAQGATNTIAIMDKKLSANAEALARKLQENLQHERPRWVRWVPWLALVLLVTLGIMAWLHYPALDPPHLTVTAFDAL